MLKLYKLQIINAQSQEILREKLYKKPDLILSLMEDSEKGHECFLFDENLRTYKGVYVSHTCFTEGDMIIYKVLFNVILSEIQARIAR
jgi:hypothetical protein